MISINDIFEKMECSLLCHSLAVLKPWKFDRSSTRQDEGWKIMDEILRFVFGDGTKFSGDRRMFFYSTELICFLW